MAAEVIVLIVSFQDHQGKGVEVEGSKSGGSVDRQVDGRGRARGGTPEIKILKLVRWTILHHSVMSSVDGFKTRIVEHNHRHSKHEKN